MSGEARPGAVLATTFTVKAISALRRSVRTHLLKAARSSDAQRLSAARIGTVNAVCGQLVNDFAFELGLSPDVGVLDEDGANNALKMAMSSVLTEEDEQLASRLVHMLGEWDWQEAVQQVVSLVRSNGISPEALASCSERSRDSWPAVAAGSRRNVDELDAELLRTTDALIEQYSLGTDGTKKTDKALTDVRRAHGLLKGGREVPWKLWAKLASLDVGAKSQDAAEPVIEAASAHDIHPKLYQDVGDAIALVFDIASRTLEAYREHKLAHGVIDFVDQEVYALRLLAREDVRSRLADEIDLVLIDEFQDTSPIQLAIFLQLATIARRSVWVGDQKQAIYGFRGTDPKLMDAAVEQIIEETEPEMLAQSWRSRPELVRLTSALFTPAFEAAGIPAARVHLEPARDEEPAGLGEILEIWRLNSRNQEGDAVAIADATSQLLQDDVKVRDPITMESRPLRPSDVAILCRTNATCMAVAHALSLQDIRAVLPRVGILSTLEGRVVFSALMLWVDPRDSLAAAELAYLIDYPADGDAWLTRAVEAENSDVFGDCIAVRNVLAAREANSGASPVEALDAVMEATGSVEMCHRWGSTSPRLANLENLRAHAVNYIESRLGEGSAASTAGLVRHLASLPDDKLDTQGVSTGEMAVTVSTWHRAKGLEWPITVLFGIDKPLRGGTALGVKSASDQTAFNANDPLAQRWIRYWPYPYGGMSKGIPLNDRLAVHPVTAEAESQSEREGMRLLYVGWTRARDRLILASRPGKLGDGMLASLDTDGSHPLSEPDGGEVEWVGRKVPVKTREGNTGVVTPRPPEPEPALPKHELRTHPQAWQFPSAVDQHGPTEEPIILGTPISVSGTPEWADLGNAVHGFIAADSSDLPPERRKEIAAYLQEAWSVDGAISTEHFLEVADRLWNWIDAQWDGYRRHREWPLAMKDDNGTQWTGAADLVLEFDDHLVLIDHKTFPGAVEQASTVASSSWGQISAYRQMLEAGTGKRVTAAYIHLPVLGAIVPMALDGGLRIIPAA